MGAVYKETYTKPRPPPAEVFARKAERFARWTDGRGWKRTARVTTPTEGKHAGTDRIIVEATTYTAGLHNDSWHVVKVPTGCRSLDAAGASHVLPLDDSLQPERRRGFGANGRK